MVAALLGKKVGMTQVYNDEGRVIPVTVIEAGPCDVLQVRGQETDGYEAVQLGFDEKKPARATKAEIGHCGKAGVSAKRFVREIRMDGAADHQAGEQLTVDVFEQTETKYVDIVGTSKGKGFAGVIKRHGFGGQRASHGVKRVHRMPGSISSHGAELGRSGGIKKGKRMAGRMGNERCTVRNQELTGIIKDKNLLLVKGNVPGPSGGYVMIRASKTRS